MLSEKEATLTGESIAIPVTKDERARKKLLGIYYTPPEAAMILARWAIRQPTETVLEPSFGGCAMLSAAVSIFKSLGNDSPSKQLYGYDVDSAAFEYLADMGIDNEENHFKKQDFLRSRAGDLRVNAVLANPPFVSYHRQNTKQREQTEKLRQRYMPQLPRLASLWAFFLLHSMSFLRPGGRMAFVLPNAIGNADYAKPLLQFLATKFEEMELVHVGERLFIQAGADERISFLLLAGYVAEGVAKPKQMISRDIARVNELLSDDEEVTLKKPDEFGDVRHKAEAALATLKSGSFSELGKSATITIGEVVGDINFFVRPRAVWKSQKIDAKYLNPLLTRASQVRGIYVRKHADDTTPLLIPQLLIPPTKRMPKAIESYLSAYAESSISENRTFGKREVWHGCSYQNNADAFIGSMNHDYPRIIGNNASISCSNAFYKIVITDNPALATWLPILSVTTPLRLSAEVLGRVRGSGGIKLEPSDVKNLCVPTTFPQMAEEEFIAVRGKIDELVRKGELDAAGQIADSIIFLKTGLIDGSTLSKLRTMRLTLTTRRLAKLR